MRSHESADIDTEFPLEASNASGGIGASVHDVGTLYRHTHAGLLRQLQAKLGSEQEARDVAQEAYARLLRLRNDAGIQQSAAYLYRVADNLAIDRLRERTRRREAQNVDAAHAQLIAQDPHADRVIDGERRLEQLQRLLAELPPKCRLAFMLHRFEGLDYKDIALQMRVTESMVRKYVLRALRYCMERFESLDGDSL
jgi:RNA polymerase sigma factor (sigma-70 family)